MELNRLIYKNFYKKKYKNPLQKIWQDLNLKIMEKMLMSPKNLLEMMKKVKKLYPKNKKMKVTKQTKRFYQKNLKMKMYLKDLKKKMKWLLKKIK